MTKQALRERLAAIRSAVPEAWRAAASERIALHLLDSPAFAAATAVSAYVSLRLEAGTRALIPEIIRRKGWAAVPRQISDGSLALYRVRSFPEGFAPGPHGVLEPLLEVHPEVVPPESLGLVLAPGLGFDRAGRRLGYGKGFYDRLLARASGALVLGLAFSFQIVPRIPAEAHDVPVDGVVTEEGIIMAESASD